MKVAFSTFSAGQFLPGASLLHVLDARLKLVGTVGFAAALFLVRGWPGLALLALGLGTLYVVAGAPLRYLWRSLRPLVVLLVITFAFQAISIPGHALASLGPFSITTEGLARGAFLTIRLALLLFSSTLLTLTTAPVALTDGVEWLLRPLRPMRVPTHEVALMMTIALRFIPTLLHQLDDLVKAQRVRGADLRLRDPFKLGQAVMPLVVPLFVLSFRRAEELAVAMTSRCYRGGRGRTRYREMRFGARDGAAAALMAVLFAAALTAGRLWGPA
jgi:energy-coupling factor transport system permease protein